MCCDSSKSCGCKKKLCPQVKSILDNGERDNETIQALKNEAKELGLIVVPLQDYENGKIQAIDPQEQINVPTNVIVKSIGKYLLG